jgi:uncharacterized protein YdiU (UPF0061 family)
MNIPSSADFAGVTFDNTYARLPERFFSRIDPTPVAKPGLIKINHGLALELGFDPAALESDEGVQALAGNRVPHGAEPIAQAYTGHQFGYLNPRLGDGRAILLGEVIDRNGLRRDVQLKGPGRTPYSRSGDGRAALGPVLREYLVSEAMYHLGIKTTRTLAAVTTGQPVYRETTLPGAVLTRVAASHIRIGTFEYFRVNNDQEGLKILADYVIQRHYPEIQSVDDPYLALLEVVMYAQAQLVSSWLQVGFIHGVMNTDNMTVSGETIDYGPCAFMDIYDPATVFSSIDREGRYAYGNQGAIALWNLSRFAECLLPLLDGNIETAVKKAEEVLGDFSGIFNDSWLAGMGRKIGLSRASAEDEKLIADFLQLLRDGEADFTLAFRLLADCIVATRDNFLELFNDDKQGINNWLGVWRARLAQQKENMEEIAVAMHKVNPLYIPRNQDVENVLQAAVENSDYQPFEELLTVLSKPFEEQEGMEKYAAPPVPTGERYRTFCGT